jgi:hypothetical protein
MKTKASSFHAAVIMPRVVLTAALLLASVGPLFAISEGGAIFLMIRPGARASGMGSAFCAVADDATATYFNPAGLAFLSREAGVHLVSSDIRDWRRLSAGFQGGEEDFLLDAGDIKDPEGVAVKAGNSPLFIQADVADWPGLMTRLAGRDSSAAASGLDSRLDPAIGDSIKGLDSAGLGPDQKALLVHALNGLLADRSLFRLPALAEMPVSDEIWEAIDRAVFTDQKNSVKPEEIAEPRLMAQRLADARDAAAKQVARSLGPKAKSALAKQAKLEPDSLRRVLAAELSRIVKGGPLYQPAWTSEFKLKPATRQLAAMSLKGDELVRLNLRLLADAFPREIEYRFERSLLSDNEARTLNRLYLEAILVPAVGRLADRSAPGADEKAVRERLSGAASRVLSGYDGRQSLRAEDVTVLVDELNRMVADQSPILGQPVPGVSTHQANRQAIDRAFPMEILRSADQKPKTARLYLRQRLGRPSAELFDKLSQDQEPGDDDQRMALEALNTLIEADDLYQPEYFPRASLGSEAKSLVAEGAGGLSGRKLRRLNRLLLESVFPDEISKAGAEAKPRYATLMHSPWLSEIWGDVGDMYYEFIAYAQPVKDWGVFGGNVIFLSEGKNQHLDEQGNVLGEFSSYEFSPTLSYGNKVLPGLGAGVNLKVIHSHLAPFGPPGTQGKGVATTWAVDLGLLYHVGVVRGLSLGANLQNLGPKLVYIDAQQADPLSRNLRLGIAYKALEGRITRLTTAFDITRTVVDFSPSWSGQWWKSQWQEAVIHFGTEYVYNGFVQLALRYGLVYDRTGRIGTKLNSAEPKFSLGEASTFGGSVGYRRISFDVALEPGGELMNGTKNKKFALSFNF